MYKSACSFSLLFFCLCLPACYDSNSTYSSGLVESSFRNVTMDSCTVNITSVLIDSLETSGKGLALIGQYRHPLWGTVRASGYVAYERPAYDTEVEATVVLDSCMLSLSYSGNFVGDTTQVQQFNVYKLADKIILNDNGYLYNNSSFPYDAAPLGTCSFRPKPRSGEKLEIRLPDELGRNLLDRFHSRDEAVSADRFPDYFKGIVVMPDEAVSQSLLTFSVSDSSAIIVLYYHVSEEVKREKTLIFSPNTETQFNRIEHDRTGTLMDGYPLKQVEIPSRALDGRGVLFGGTGWYTRLEFPHLNNIMQHGEQVNIESALLKIYPEPGTYSDFNPLPDSIFLYIADENNVVTDAVTDYLGSEVQSGVLVRDYAFESNTYYYFDVTDFMQEELGTIGMYKHNLQLVFSSDDYTGTVRNLTFSDQSGRSPIVLQLTYKIYESY